MKQMREIEKICYQKFTENGDDAYCTTGDKLIDILFMSQYYRYHLNEVPFIADEEKAKLFAMFIRDPRCGLGERDLGKKLLKQVGATPEEMAFCGRFDDLLEIYPEYVIEKAKGGNELARKWLPRLSAGKTSRIQAKALCKQFKLSEKEYRSICKVSTAESKLSENKINEIAYERVPSLALLKYWNVFKRKDEKRFKQYKEGINSSKCSHPSVLTCYDIFKTFVSLGGEVRVDADAEIVFKQLEKVNLGNVLPIVDVGGSVSNGNDWYGKMMAIGHYAAVNSTYFPNHVIRCGNEPKLLDLGNTYASAMYTMCSQRSYDKADFGQVMKLLANLNEEFPDYLLILSNMEFEKGSKQSKTETMEQFKEKGAQTKIVWWNFNVNKMTCPEMDDYGNIFISGYSPQILALMESGFNQQIFMNTVLEVYGNYVNENLYKKNLMENKKEKRI